MKSDSDLWRKLYLKDQFAFEEKRKSVIKMTIDNAKNYDEKNKLKKIQFRIDNLIKKTKNSL
ncbi:MAG TPA: DUF3135 domain-containing protein [Aeromonadales bacterium]|nr:DUF3135 domain-containing protein [Aeromonadales bacterium]